MKDLAVFIKEYITSQGYLIPPLLASIISYYYIPKNHPANNIMIFITIVLLIYLTIKGIQIHRTLKIDLKNNMHPKQIRKNQTKLKQKINTKKINANLKNIEKEGSKEKSEKSLSEDDLGFLIGLGLFILYLALIQPYTPEILHNRLIIWTSISMLFLFISPNYLNEERARSWFNKYKETKLSEFYKRIYIATQKSETYLKSEKFFVVGIVITLATVIILFSTGDIPEAFLGISYGVLMRAILT